MLYKSIHFLLSFWICKFTIRFLRIYDWWCHYYRQSCWSLSWNSSMRKEHTLSSRWCHRFSWTHLTGQVWIHGRFSIGHGLTDIWDYRLLLCKFVALDLLWFTVCICQFLIRLAICRKLLPFSEMAEELPFSSINGNMHNSSVTGTIHWEVMVS